MLTEIEFEILYTVLMNPSININRLYKKLRGRVSKNKLIKLTKRLIRIGLIYAVPDKNHKQRLLLFVKEDLKNLADVILNKALKRSNDVLDSADSLIKNYIKFVNSVSDPLAQWFLKKLLLKILDEILP